MISMGELKLEKNALSLQSDLRQQSAKLPACAPVQKRPLEDSAVLQLRDRQLFIMKHLRRRGVLHRDFFIFYFFG